MMKNRRQTKIKSKIILHIVQSLSCFVLVFLSLATHAQTENLTVISNEKGAPDQLKLSELKSILMGEKQRWRNGNKITIALMKTNTPAGTYTCKKIYDMSGDELKKFWLALVFQGKADPPEFFNSVAEIESFVAENPGAIGVIDQQPASADTRIVLIDGKKTL
jgi:hypothetical protein